MQLMRQYEQSPVKYDADALEFKHARELKQQQKVKRRSSLKTYKVSRLICISVEFGVDSKGNYSATANDTKLVHWPLMGGTARRNLGGLRAVPSSLYLI